MSTSRRALGSACAVLVLVLAGCRVEEERPTAAAGGPPPNDTIARAAAPSVTGSSPAPSAARPSGVAVGADGRRVLRVCADPNNLPFSNDRGEGFENKLAELVAEELDARLEYTWWAQRRGFIRNTLRAGLCDVVMGVPSSFELVLPTRPYYRSTYVFVYRKDAGIAVRSFDDPALRTLRVGVHFIGDDYTNAPPAHALGRRGIVRNVRGYSIYGDYSRPNPPAEVLAALARGEIDVAVVWGPLAGYFAPHQRVPLAIVPVSPQIDLPFLPFVYDIAMGVRRDAPGLQQELDRVLARRRADVERILDDYGVPRAPSAVRVRGQS